MATTWRLYVSRLLVVDDDIQMLSALEATLRRKGHTVETASNGIEAASKFRPPDLVEFRMSLF
jgi:DNA-binding response OmpR family regulator